MTQQTSNEDFEKWYKNSKYQLSKDNTRLYLYEAWQAATAESDKRIAELEDEINDLKKEQYLLNKWLDNNKEWFDKSEKEKTKLQAHINVLREALEFYNDAEFPYSIANDALTLTPAQSLQEYDNDMIERVVTLLKDSAWDDGIIDMRVDDLIEDVRKLKAEI